MHCKAGLGRTGVLICCYMIKHFRFTAQEAIGYIRICRPGSVIGPQQNYLIEHAPFLLQEGQVMQVANPGAPGVRHARSLHTDMCAHDAFTCRR